MKVLELGYPPSINHYYMQGRGSRRYLSPTATAYRWDVKSRTSGSIEQIEGDVALQIIIIPPDKRRRDIDNILKCTIDSLQHAGFFKDDYQVCELSVKRLAPKKPGKLIVEISKSGIMQ